MSNELTPETRRELYYDAMLGGDDMPADPHTREERYLEAIVEAIEAGSSDEKIQEAVNNYMEDNPDAFEEAISPLIAPEYDETVAYKAGILLSYQGKLYECIKDATAGTLPTNTTYFKEVSVAEKLGDLQTGLENGTIVPNKSRATESIENVSDESGTTQDNPFISQGTGTNNNVDSVDTSPVAKQIEKQGYTIPVMQLGQTTGSAWTSFDQTTGMGTSHRDNTEGSTQVYITMFSFLGTNGHKYYFEGAKTTNLSYIYVNASVGQKNIKNGGVCEANQTDRLYVYGAVPAGVDGNITFFPRIWDITSWDSDIITDLTSHPEHFSWYYNGSPAYDAGSLKNASGRYLVCTHRNIFDEQMELGTISGSTGAKTDSTSHIRSKNYIEVIPNRAFYFRGTANFFAYTYDKDKNFIGDLTISGGYNNPVTMPANARYVLFRMDAGYGTTYKHDITISLYYSAEQGGEGYDQYYPYQEPSVYDTGTEVLRQARSVRDTKIPSGLITHNISENGVDLSLFSWTLIEGDGYWYWRASFLVGTYGQKTYASGNDIRDGSHAKYTCTNQGRIGYDLNSVSWTNDLLYVVTDAKTNEPSGILYYALNNPTTEQGTSFAENIEIDDYGMMYWLDTDGNLVDIPQGVKVFYPADYVLWLDTAVSTTNGDATDIALKSEITDSALADRGYNKTSDLSSSITDSAGLTYSIKKLYKIGNVITLSIKAKNETGSAISADTELFTMPNDTYISSSALIVSALVDGTACYARIGYSTNKVNISAQIANNSTLCIFVSYAIA